MALSYSLDASGQTGNGGQPTSLWPVNSAGDGLFIQNLSGARLDVMIARPESGGVTPAPIVIRLPNDGDWVDETKVAPTAAVSVRAYVQGATFAAFRTQS